MAYRYRCFKYKKTLKNGNCQGCFFIIIFLINSNAQNGGNTPEGVGPLYEFTLSAPGFNVVSYGINVQAVNTMMKKINKKTKIDLSLFRYTKL